MTDQFLLFIDLDGVLADFDRGVFKATGNDPSELHPGKMWPVLARTPGFYEGLEWMDDGPALWDAVKAFNPVILTGLPMGRWAEPQKRSWCARELGRDVPVIAGMSRHKAELARAWMVENRKDHLLPVLVDDRLKLKDPWEHAGGRFVLHLNTPDSLLLLAGLGFPV
jgi:hypothetical protein